MNANKKRITQFLQSDYKFIIPVYQRRYDWRKEQCQQLLDDLLNLLPRAEQYKHFFGCVVCSSPSLADCIIIDGQQRLTTVSLLMLAMARMIEEGRLQSDDPRLAKRLRDKYLADYDDERQPKFRHSRDDAAAFCCLLNGQPGPDNSNITLNYRYFCQCLARQGLTPDQLFSAIERLEICVIDLEQGDDPQLIFESLNSTGLRLSEGDKIRNYILMHITDPAQQQRWYEDYWQRIEEDCTCADGSAALDDFIRDYLTAKMSTIPNKDKIYTAFKDYCADCGDRLEVLRDLLRYAPRYRILLQGGSAFPRLNQCIWRLNYLGTGVARPYLLEVLDMHEAGALTDEELLWIFESVESFCVRRFVCSLPTNSLNKIFQTLHRNILRDGSAEHTVYVDRLNYHLISRWGAGRFPDDGEFRQTLADMNVYALHPSRRLYLLERLENARTREQHEIYGNDAYSVEHIMPQTLSDEWRRELGADCQGIHERWLHHLANLTLTAYNSEYSNCSFTRKRDMEHGFRDSGLRLNHYLSRIEHWDETALQARQEQLLDDALVIWPRPVSSYCPRRPPEESMTLAEWDTAGGYWHLLANRRPLRCILLGQELQTATWRNMLLA